ncbi:MAG TPA: response regulator [Candidatus Limnocylindria bacterium]|jgi:CheY-like chemotaxis protein
MALTERRARPILIVDDDKDTLAAERAVLAEGGFSVLEAHDGAEALLALSAETPAMIVLDVNMPGIDGPTFARELRTRLRHVPLVIVTAAPDPKREADRCNAEAYLAKPFHADDLLRLARRFST